MEQDELISHDLGELAGQAGPARVDVAEVARLVRRRRRLQTTATLTGCVALTAGVLGGVALWPEGRPTGTSVNGSTLAGSPPGPRQTAPKDCGAPPRSRPLPLTALASEPPLQPVLDDAARRIEQIAGGGKDVTKGGAKPGTYNHWYGGVEIDNAWAKVIVYRVPGSELDAAICAQIKNVTVELRDSIRSAAEANRLADRISREVGLGPHRGFQLFTMAIHPDGTLRFTSDHPDAALRALREYGPGVTVTPGQPIKAA